MSIAENIESKGTIVKRREENAVLFNFFQVVSGHPGLHEHNFQEIEQRSVVIQSRRHMTKSRYLMHSWVCPAVSFLPGRWADVGAVHVTYTQLQPTEGGR